VACFLATIEGGAYSLGGLGRPRVACFYPRQGHFGRRVVVHDMDRLVSARQIGRQVSSGIAHPYRWEGIDSCHVPEVNSTTGKLLSQSAVVLQRHERPLGNDAVRRHVSGSETSSTQRGFRGVTAVLA
jgi:hypothetical protein